MTHATETSRRPWLILGAGWALAAALIVIHTVVVADYVALLNRAAAAGADPPPTPLRQIIPARHADAQMWIRHAIEGAEAGQARVRFTTVDNAPSGREVHWSSGPGWLIRGAAILEQRLSGKAPAAAIESVLPWLNAPLLFAAVVIVSAWTARRLGAAAGVLVACAMVGHPRFYEAFAPTYLDHHGLVNVAILVLVLGAAFMGFGWVPPDTASAPNAAGDAGLNRGHVRGSNRDGERGSNRGRERERVDDPSTRSRSRPPMTRHFPAGVVLPAAPGPARRAAIISALGGALAMWLNAATALPAIAFVGIAGLAASRWWGPRAATTGVRFDPALWQTWGRTGGIATLACYLLEYAPSHLGWRLEVNHPLYALAWWGGGELVARLGEARCAAAEPRLVNGRQWVLPLVALAAAPVAILLGGGTTFLLGDPFIGELRHFVAESRSIAAQAARFGFRDVASDLVSLLIFVPAMVVLLRHDRPGKIAVAALTAITAALVVMAFFVVRWWVVASAAQIALLVHLVVAVGRTPRSRTTLALAAGALLLLPTAWQIVRDHRANRQGKLAEMDLFQPVYRDLAATLQATSPGNRITLLASPNASAGIAYFGRFQSIGTLFWENAPGLRAAAAMLCAERDDDARQFLRARGVTHIVLFSDASFIGEYFQLLHPNRPRADAERTFGFRLATDPANAPAWLQAIPHRRHGLLAGIGGQVWLYKVVPEQPEDQRLFHVATAQAAGGQAAAAEQSFLAAAERVTPRARASFLGFAGESAYEQGSNAVAVRLLRRSLALADDPNVANITAWILATSVEAGVRDGAAALALVGPVAKRQPDDPVILSTLAATYAELGRFEPAVAAAERALALVRSSGVDAGSIALLTTRLESYRSRQPWRQ